jgi:hypothetical protein
MIVFDRRSEAEELDVYGVGSSAQRAPNWRLGKIVAASRKEKTLADVTRRG